MSTAKSDRTAETTAEFRERLRAFLSEHGPGARPHGSTARLAWTKRWYAILADGGYAAPSWPAWAGGMDLPFDRQVVYAEEAGRAGVPRAPGTGHHIAAPTIIRHGTDEQHRRWLAPLLRADEVWAQGWSEPDAGSDLPSLRARAVRDGDDYVVTGQKVWSSFADIADWLFTLVRTGPDGSRQDGISYLVIPADSAGVTIRPIRDLTGGADFCEIFFDEVRVPIANRIGEENGGWPIARTSMGHERAALALTQATFYRRILDQLLDLARERGASDDPVMRQRLAHAESLVRIMHVSGARIISHISEHGEPGALSSVTRVYNTETEQLLHELAIDLIGAQSTLAPEDPHSVQRGRWTRGFLRTRAATIGAGTAEIQRNTIAESVLGLPRDPAMP